MKKKVIIPVALQMSFDGLHEQGGVRPTFCDAMITIKTTMNAGIIEQEYEHETYTYEQTKGNDRETWIAE